MSGSHPIEKLITVMARLRDPDGGCPWDLEQDFASIAPHTVEEAYEVADAIARGDMDNLREELGDLLFQPVYHAQMAAEAGLFTIEDVIEDVTAKMIARHPHVFDKSESAACAADVNAIWEARKAREKPAGGSALDGVALALPALLRAQKLQKKAAKTGFEWTKAADILDKFEEELAEMREAVAEGSLEDRAEELGDLLFVLANLGRLLGVNCEEALQACNRKFERRFKGMEGDLEPLNQSVSDLSLDQMTRLWDEQKLKERSALKKSS